MIRSARVTMSDVARLARVSRVTASKVLNDPSAGSPGVRRRIEAACERLDYVPNLYARKLVSGRSRTIGLLVSSLTNAFYAEIVEAAEREALRHDHDLVYRCSGDDPGLEAQMLRHLISLDVVGVVATPVVTRLNLALWRRVSDRRPVVFVDHHFTTRDTFVIADHEAGASAATDHLLARGVDAALLEASASPDHSAVAARRAGYIRAIQRHKRRPCFIPGDRTLHARPEAYGHAAVLAYLETHPAPRGLFCTNDLHALGAMRAFAERGLQVGRDVLLVGYDDDSFAPFLSPSLTTVRQPKAQLGAQAVLRVLEQASSQVPFRPRHQILPVELVERESTGAPVERPRRRPRP